METLSCMALWLEDESLKIPDLSRPPGVLPGASVAKLGQWRWLLTSYARVLYISVGTLQQGKDKETLSSQHRRVNRHGSRVARVGGKAARLSSQARRDQFYGEERTWKNMLGCLCSRARLCPHVPSLTPLVQRLSASENRDNSGDEMNLPERCSWHCITGPQSWFLSSILLLATSLWVCWLLIP